MPTAEQFDAMAGELESLDEHLAGVSGSVEGAIGATKIQGGPVESLIDAAGMENVSAVTAARGLVGTAVDVCRDRAQQCRRYSELYNGYELAMSRYVERARALEPGEHIGSPPWPPRSPGPWAERS